MIFLNFDQSEHIMGPGSHVGFPISAKNKNLVYDHPMNISAKFDSNLTFIYDVELNIHLTISSFTSYVFVSKHILASGIPLKANSSNSFNNVCNTKQNYI